MNNRLTLLGILLTIQLVIVLLLNLSPDSDEPTTGLLNIAADAVSGITITANDGATVSLRRDDGRWWLLNNDVAIAADDAKVNDVLTRLVAMNSLWPVAASASSRERFETSASNFQQRLDFSGGGEEGDEAIAAQVYLGNSPGYRRVHASNGESDNVYSIEFAAYEVPADPSEWLDHNQLQHSGVTGLTLTGSWQLRDGPDGWQVNGQPADDQAATDMVRRIEMLRLLGIFQGDTAALGEARELEIRIGDETETWMFRQDPEADEYVLTSSRTPGEFTVASYIAEQILVDEVALAPAPAAEKEAHEAPAPAAEEQAEAPAADT